jgi:nucleotide-binding universal stress UspA family protein
MRTILLLTDFSETARNAASFAVDMFKDDNVLFVLLNAYDAEFGGSPYIMQVKEEIAEESAKGLKKELAFLHSQLPNGRFELASRYGPLVEVILKEMHEDEIDPDFIVLGCRGESALENFLLGSNAFDVIKNIHKPMLAIPSMSEFKSPEKVVFVTDLEIIDKEMAKPLHELVTKFNCELLFVNIIEDEYLNKLEAEDKITSYFPETKMSFHFIEDSDVYNSVTLFAEENNADMIVLIRHNYSFLERLFRPSLTKKMLMQPQFPMLILHSH